MIFLSDYELLSNRERGKQPHTVLWKAMDSCKSHS